MFVVGACEDPESALWARSTTGRVPLLTEYHDHLPPVPMFAESESQLEFVVKEPHSVDRLLGVLGRVQPSLTLDLLMDLVASFDRQLKSLGN
ncbi:hypothetical protein [Nocardia sp. NPDC052112]|uniref:hypothetical protein n=1 Tax=Nocardia sp. NPDC052112 TaxID=3155646 RepID=UPI003440CE6B